MRRSIVGVKLPFAAALFFIACIQMRSQGGSVLAPADASHLAQNGGYYALVIGINDYSRPLPKLATAVADARSIAQVLRDNYGFQVKLLLDQDATRSNILNAIVQYRNKLDENDNLLIYYAGHGISDRRTEKAYWIPVDADSVDSPNRIIADDITSQVSAQSARHVLIVSDSCYSGGLTRGADTLAESSGQIAYLNRVLGSRSRTLMASGGDEPVSDGGPEGHSVFAFALLRSLQQMDQTVFTASDLFYGSVRQRVAGRSAQLPEYSIIRNSSHDDGDFVFVRRAAAERLATAKLPSIENYGLLRTLEGHTSKVGTVTFSPDGRILASGSSDQSIKLWDVNSGQLLSTLQGHTGWVRSVAFSPDGRTLASGGDDGTVKLWDIATGRVLRTLHSSDAQVDSVAFSPDGRTLASGGLSIQLWDTGTGQLLRALQGHTKSVWTLAFSPSGSKLASGSWDGTIKLWDSASGKMLASAQPFEGFVNSVAFSPDGHTLAAGGSDNRSVSISLDLVDASTFKLLRTLQGHSSYVSSVTFSRDGRTLASGSNETILWDVASGQALHTFVRPGNEGTYSVALSPDGRMLATATNGAGPPLIHGVRIWNIALP